MAAAPAPTFAVLGPQRVGLGERIELRLVVKGVSDVAGYEAVVRFDPAAADFAGVQQRHNDLRQFGRDVTPLAAVEVPYGAAIGVSSCVTADCVSGQGPRHARGGHGTLRLATIWLTLTQPGVLEVVVDAVKVVDAAGMAVPVALEGTILTIQVGPAGAGGYFPAPPSPWQLAATPPGPAAVLGQFDVAPDGQVSHADVMEVALAWTWLRERSAPCGEQVDPLLDVTHDGCIDIADLQTVAAHYTSDGTPAATAAAATTPLTFSVTTTGDAADAVIGDGLCQTAAATCTLRAAIQEANAHAGPDTIRFTIPGTGVHTIQLTGQLPSLFGGGTTIDGYSQPGAVPNTDLRVSNALIRIEVLGKGEDQFSCVKITSAGNLISGLSIAKCTHQLWLFGSGAQNNVVTGSFVGTNASATYGAATDILQARGIEIEQGAARNRIGGPSPAERNVISGNARTGVAAWHEATDSMTIQNNIVGLSPDGTRRLANRKHGVDLNFGSSNNLIQDNVLSGNDDSGIEISHEYTTANNQVLHNFIGTDVTGTRGPAYARNSGRGVMLEDGASNNLISDNVIGNNGVVGVELRFTSVTGRAANHNTITRNHIGGALDGTPIPNPAGIWVNGDHNSIGPDNLIAYNSFAGIRVGYQDGMRIDTADFNTITRNQIWGNGGLGIELWPQGPNLIDPNDPHTGPNQHLDFPILTSASLTAVSGTACPGCTVEVFVADRDGSGYGEGKVFLGAATAAADGSFAVPIAGVVGGQGVTATATDARGNTSEFARNRTVTTSGTLPAAPSNLSAQRAGPPNSQRITLTWTDNASNETGFVLERKIGSAGTWGVLVALPASTTSYTDTAVQRSTTYSYRVKATNSAGSSAYSNVASATTK